MLVTNYNILLMFIAVCFYMAFPIRGEVTARDTELKNILFSFIGIVLSILTAQTVVSGQVIESFSFESQITGQLQHYFLYLVAVIMFIILVINIIYYIQQRVES